MKLKIFKPSELNKKFRLSVHRTGRLGFTSEAASKLKLEEIKSADFASNEDDLSDQCLYMLLHKGEEGGFKLNKNGDYYSINMNILLDNLRINYEKGNIWFEIEEKQIGEEKVYKMDKRERIINEEGNDS